MCRDNLHTNVIMFLPQARYTNLMSQTATVSELTIGEAPKRKGFALRESLSSVTAGVGSIFQGSYEAELPETKDVTSKEALEKFKEYNTNTTLRASEKSMWGYTIEGVARSILTGLTFAVATALMAVSPIGPVATGVLAIVGVTAMSVGLFYTFQQSATKEQTDKYMDVGEFGRQRSAEMTAQAIVKALDEREGKGEQHSHSHTQEVIVVKEAANENKPSSQIAASTAEQALQPRLEQAETSKTASL